jgi:hypothetical protein
VSDSCGGVLGGYCIWFLGGIVALKSREPSAKQIASNPALYTTINEVIEEWLLLEIACIFEPTNKDAILKTQEHFRFPREPSRKLQVFSGGPAWPVSRPQRGRGM